MREAVRDSLRTTAYPLYAALNMAYRSAVSLRNVYQWNRAVGVTPLWRHSLPEGRNQEPFFILGSGSSVNSFSREQWDRIARGVSIGLNYWVFHDFVPTLLMFELSGLRDEFFAALRSREREYASTALVIKSSYLNRRECPDVRELIRRIPAGLHRNLFVSWDFPVPGVTPAEFERSIRALAGLGFFRARSRVVLSAQSRATVGYAVNYAIQSGCREIVLCGVDLNNTDYFYSDDPAFLVRRGIARFESGQTGTVHLTDDPAYAPLTISSALESTAELVCRPRGIRMSVGSRKSALYPAFPMYFEERSRERAASAHRESANTECSPIP